MTTTKVFLNSLAAALLAASCSVALAASAGTVQHLSGTLSAQNPDGSVRILSQKSEVNPGQVVTTQRDSYAQINFTDGSSMTMRPNTQMKIENYEFSEARPEADNAFFRLLKGGLRTVTGLVGKRGNQDAYRIGTATATIGIRGSSNDIVDCTQGGEAGNSCEKVDKGVYMTTYTGSYIMQNEGGSQIIGPGEFGFARDATSAPQVLPKDPGLNLAELPFVLGQVPKQQQECAVR
jgi:hypothetical protein